MNEVTRTRLFGDGTIPHGIGQKVGLAEGLRRMLGTDAVSTPTVDGSAMPVADAHPTVMDAPVQVETGPSLRDAAASLRLALTGAEADVPRVANDGLAIPQSDELAAITHTETAAVDQAPGARSQRLAEVRDQLRSAASYLQGEGATARGLASGDPAVISDLPPRQGLSGLLSGGRKPIIDTSRLPGARGSEEAAEQLAKIGAEAGERTAAIRAAFKSLRGTPLT